MTPQQFTLASQRTRLGLARLEAARRVLVGGERPSNVARALGLHRQAVSEATRIIRQALVLDGACPACGRAL